MLLNRNQMNPDPVHSLNESEQEGYVHVLDVPVRTTYAPRGVLTRPLLCPWLDGA